MSRQRQAIMRELAIKSLDKIEFNVSDEEKLTEENKESDVSQDNEKLIDVSKAYEEKLIEPEPVKKKSTNKKKKVT